PDGKVLRGHEGEVRGLAFAPTRPDKPPLLVSAALEKKDGKPAGVLRLWDAAAGKELARRDGLPGSPERIGLAVWHTGPQPRQVRVAVSWPEKQTAEKPVEGTFRLWDAA